MATQHAVIENRRYTDDVFELVLERAGVQFKIGDCVAVYGADAITSRPYSICSGVNTPTLNLLVRALPDGVVSRYLQERQPGDSVTLDPPFGWFRPGPGDSDAPFAFVATGTGIAPFLSYLRSHPEKPPVRCLYGVRELADAVAVDVLQAACPHLRLAVSREQVSGYHHGRVTDLVDDIPLLPDLQVFLCGLDTMIDEVSVALEKRGLHFASIHREVFFHAAP
jgi:ferredoxin-NADP reductase